MVRPKKKKKLLGDPSCSDFKQADSPREEHEVLVDAASKAGRVGLDAREFMVEALGKGYGVPRRLRKRLSMPPAV